MSSKVGVWLWASVVALGVSNRTEAACVDDGGGTRTAASAEEQDIQDCIDDATDGDVINIPPGDVSWTSTITLNKEVSLVGAGAHSAGTNITQTGPNGYVSIDGVDHWSVSFFSFDNTSASWDWVLYLRNGGEGWTIHNNVFRGYHFAIGGTRGTYYSANTSSVIFMNEFHGGGVQFWGPNDDHWAEDTDLGTKRFLFIERNLFTDAHALSDVTHPVAMNGGIRAVVRYNEFHANVAGIDGPIDFHGY